MTYLDRALSVLSIGLAGIWKLGPSSNNAISEASQGIVAKES